MVVSELEASKKSCPYAKSEMRTGCKGSGCMMWRVVGEVKEETSQFYRIENSYFSSSVSAVPAKQTLGYCGLAGKP